MQPRLVIIAGRPGAGKSTLSELLGRELHLPVISRDKFKEGYVNSAGKPHALLDSNANRQVYDVYFQTIELMLKNNVSLIAEAAFQHGLWAPQIETLSKLAKISIIVCSVDPILARSRVIERGKSDDSREHFHGDKANLIEKDGQSVPLLEYSAPYFPELTLNVDCSDSYSPSIKEIVNFVKHGID